MSDATSGAYEAWAATALRRRLTSEQYQSHGGYEFALTADPLTPSDAETLVRAALWERFQGWDHEPSAAARVAVAAIAEFGGLPGREAAKPDERASG